LTEAQLVSFLQVEFGRVGADTHLTPREVIRDFIELLDIVCQNPGTDAEALLKTNEFSGAVSAPAVAASMGDKDVDAAYAEFTI
ncbi:MAG TPA: ATP-binding protein, partial [Candidatus Olsenella avicola]|nr:ATP-binding protein [Candidatus Olsenella avicola]